MESDTQLKTDKQEQNFENIQSNTESDQLQHIRKQRGGFKAVLTRKGNEIRELMRKDTDISEINEKLEEIKEVFSQFCAKHLQYRSLTEIEEADSVDEFFLAVELSVKDIERQVERWTGRSKVTNRSDMQDSVQPNDSVSNAGSRASSLDSMKIKAKAQKAMLLAKAQSLKKMQEIKRKKMELQLYEENLELEAEITAIEAQEAVFEKFDSSVGHSRYSSTAKSVKKNQDKIQQIDQVNKQSTLNPNAAEWNTPTRNTCSIATKDVSENETSSAHTDTKLILKSVLQQQTAMNELQAKVEEICLSRTNEKTHDAHPDRSYLSHSAQFQERHTLQRPCSYDVNRDFSSMNQQQDNPSHDGAGIPLTAEDRFIILQQRMLDVAQLPKGEISRFNGDPLRYWTFVRAFDNMVGMLTLTDCVKLDRLFQFCSGKAYDVIQCCALMPPVEGYKQARKLLKERFGNEYSISKAWINKVAEGAMLRSYDKEALRQYADDVKSCMLTLDSMGKLNEVDNQAKMVKLVERLPMYLQGRWRKKAVSMLEVQGAYPNIVALADFIETAAKELNDPVFGCSQGAKGAQMKDLNKPTHSKQSYSKNNGTSLSVKANANTVNTSEMTDYGSLVCHFCEGNHPLSRCERFKAMVPEKRLIFAREKTLCYNCFSPQHRSNTCTKPSRCSFQGCKGKHSKLLHVSNFQACKSEFEKDNKKQPPTKEKSSHCSEEAVTKAHSSACNASGVVGERIALPIVPIKVRAHASRPFITACALLDTGSTNTFCSQALLDKLDLLGTDTPLTLTTLGKENDKSTAKLVSLEVSDLNESQTVNLPYVFSTTRLPVLTDNVANDIDTDRWQHLRDIGFPDIDGENVLLLIGQDTPSLLSPIEVRSGKHHEPYATRTMLGWTLNGPLQKQNGPAVVSHFVRVDNDLQAQLEHFWKLEASESIHDNSLQPSLNDKEVLGIWEQSIAPVDGHYQLDIPFKVKEPNLPNNYTLARVRLESLKRKLHSDPQLHVKYNSEIQTLLAKGYAEKVPDKELHAASGRTWYLPHHGVTSAKKPDKLRIVFDCAAKYNGSSLNDFVLQGPDLNNSLVGVLLRFREKQVGIMGDVEAMFHQVKVTPQDRDALRFLWRENGDLSERPQVFRMTVHLFGGVWSPSCASYALRHSAEEKVSEYDPEIIETVHNNFYVDDCLKSVDGPEEAKHVVSQVSSLLESGGFKITKWVSSSKEVLNSIPPDRRANELREVGVNPLPAETALGVLWKTEPDTFGFQITEKNKPETRRGVVSVVSGLFDPFGFVCPVVLQAKKLIQEECKMRKEWDDTLSDENLQKWRTWKQQLPELEDFEVKRCVIPHDFGTVHHCQLHHFSDASQYGYGCVSYIRLENTEGQIHVAFLMGKARLAPIRQMTIPRLELAAAVLSVKVDCLLRKELSMDVSDSAFWTDSMVVLHYINSVTKRFQVFVANRVACIHASTRPEQWRYVESSNNPADDASRGLRSADVISKSRWINGPEFLSKTKSDWPSQPQFTETFLDNDQEVKHAKVYSISHSCGILQEVIDRHSSWNKLKKCVAWMIRFKTLLLEKTRATDGEVFEWNRGYLKVAEVRSAETEILKVIQRQNFPEELRSLFKNKPLKRTSTLISLDPVVNSSGLLCVGGRLRKASIHDQAKHQIIVPKNHHLGTLLVRHYHHILAHAGKEHVLSEIRQNYWLINARPTINKELKACFACRKRHGKMGIQRMADLPQDRVTAGKPPFANVGIDCFGSFQVRRGRCMVKRYGCLFTCMATRAVHLEKLDTLETDSFINAFIRFQSRRGRPEKVRSDNGTNFKGAYSELQHAIRDWNLQRIESHMLQQGIQWEFNPPAASHMGGIWERQIRTVRRALEGLEQDRRLDDEGLCTVFCEAESIVNSRPLTVVSDNPQDLNPITPNHLLLLRSGSDLPYGEFTGADRYRKRWKHVQSLADHFWRRWLKEYLPSLQQRQKWHQSTKNLQIGDVVLILNENVPRREWPLGRVVKTFPGDDGLVRSVEVQTRNNVLKRPVNKLCFLESVDN